MELRFTKMSGAGNDFVMLDNRDGSIRLTREQVARICDRHRGVGADGLLLVEPAGEKGADFRMRYYNSDGGEAEMCGNGARCFARFVRSLGWKGDALNFHTPAGMIRAEFDGELVNIGLSEPRDLKLSQTVDLESGESFTLHSVNTGVPHAVVFVPDADQAMVEDWGAQIRHHPLFEPRGTNVNFVQLTGGQSIRVRTYERGVEGETLACGTGVVASAIVSHVYHKVPQPVSVRVRGGDLLEVSFNVRPQGIADVRLKGPADFVFEGKISAS